MDIDRNVGFNRAFRGYSCQQVDVVIEEMNNEIIDLKAQNASLTNAVKECTQKIEHIAGSTRQIEQERIKESMRITNLMSSAARMAEETEREARRTATEIVEDARTQADGILRQAYEDSKAARGTLDKLNGDINALRQGIDSYAASARDKLDELRVMIDRTYRDVPDVSSDVTYIPKHGVAPPSDIVFESRGADDEKFGYDPYEEFLKNQERREHQSSDDSAGQAKGRFKVNGLYE